MKIRYDNMQKESGNKTLYKKWFDFFTRWDGKLIYICFRHHYFVIDMRENWLKDMAYGVKNKVR